MAAGRSPISSAVEAATAGGGPWTAGVGTKRGGVADVDVVSGDTIGAESAVEPVT